MSGVRVERNQTVRTGVPATPRMTRKRLPVRIVSITTPSCGAALEPVTKPPASCAITMPACKIQTGRCNRCRRSYVDMRRGARTHTSHDLQAREAIDVERTAQKEGEVGRAARGETYQHPISLRVTRASQSVANQS